MKQILLSLVLLVSVGVSAQNNRVLIAHYNVENLFDTAHDQNKKDFEFLALSNPAKAAGCKNDSRCMGIDWTDQNLAVKLDQLKKVVSAMPSLPNILSVVEIENPNVAQMLARKLGYSKFLMTESKDMRGIDVALFFNESEQVKYISHTILPVPNSGPAGSTRDILAATFNINGRNVTVFTNHWPSQGHQTDARIFVAKILKTAVNQVLSKRGEVVVVGDFNTLKNEKPNPVELLTQQNDSLKLFNLDAEFRKWASQNDPSTLKSTPPGTYYYFKDRVWNLLDQALVSKGLLNDSTLSTYRIHAPAFVTKTAAGFPGRFPMSCNHNSNNPGNAGYSDHFSIYFSIAN